MTLSHHPVERRTLAVRRLQPDDAEAFQAFVKALSQPARRMRFHGAMQSCPPGLLRALTELDHDRHQAWLAVEASDGQEIVVGEGRFVATGVTGEAEFAIAIADERRGHGIADRLFHALVTAGSASGFGTLFGDVLPENDRMIAFLRRHGFQRDRSARTGSGVQRWQRRLRGRAAR